MSLLEVIPDVLLLGLIYSYLYKRLKSLKNKQVIKYNTLFYMSLSLIILITLSPFIISIPNLFNSHIKSYNFELFVDWKYQYGNYIIDTLFNIILFIPFSFSFYLATKKKPLDIIISGFLLSLLIEFIQPLLFESRIGDITDLFNNTIGTIIGVLIAYLLFRDN